MQAIEVRELEQLGDRIDALLKNAPEEKRRLHEQLARTARGLVVREISTRLSDGMGKIAGWQKDYVGSGGGYAAVRPIKSKNSTSTRKYTSGAIKKEYSPGAITNYLENGHIVRRPGQELAARANAKIAKGKRAVRESRATMVHVQGRHFYQAAREKMPAEAQKSIARFASELADKLDGR